MESQTYLELALKTASPQYNIDKIDIDEFKKIILEFITTCYKLDSIKSKLFYGKDKTDSCYDTSNIINNLNDFDFTKVSPDLLHSILGIATESSELFEEVINNSSKEKIAAEYGDILWFVQSGNKFLGTNDDQLRIANILKLAKRYGNKFNENRAVIRDLESEFNEIKTII